MSRTTRPCAFFSFSASLFIAAGCAGEPDAPDDAGPAGPAARVASGGDRTGGTVRQDRGHHRGPTSRVASAERRPRPGAAAGAAPRSEPVSGPYVLIDFPGFAEGISDEELRAKRAAEEFDYMTSEAHAWLRMGPADRNLVREAQAAAANGGDSLAAARRVAERAQNKWLRDLAFAEYARRAAAAGDDEAADAAARARIAAALPRDPMGAVDAAEAYAAQLVARGDREAAVAMLKEMIPSVRPKPVPPGQGSVELYINEKKARALANAGAPVDAAQVFLSNAPRDDDPNLAREFLTNVTAGFLSEALYKQDPAVAVRFQLEAIKKFPEAVTDGHLRSVAVLANRYDAPARTVRAVRDLLVERYPDSRGAAEVLLARADAAREAGDRDAAVGLYQTFYKSSAAWPDERARASFALQDMGVRPEPREPRPLTPTPDPNFSGDGAGAGDGDGDESTGR